MLRLVRGLCRQGGWSRLLTDALVWRIEAENPSVTVDVLFETKPIIRSGASDLGCSSILFYLGLARHARTITCHALAGDYAPWLTANLHLK